MERSPGHAFISYVRQDSRKVDRLQQMLEAAGVSVWRDTADLWPGEDWRTKIRQAITENALVFIACFSSQSIARVTTYQNEELTLAIEQLRLRRPDQTWLIPVRFDDCEIPDRDLGAGRTLASIQGADLFGDRHDEQLERLVKVVVGLLDQQQAKKETSSKVDLAHDLAQWIAGEAGRKGGEAARVEKRPELSMENAGERIGTMNESEAFEFLKKNPLMMSGKGTSLIQFYLPRGRYRLEWSARLDRAAAFVASEGKFSIYKTLETGVHTISGGRVQVRRPGHGKGDLYFQESGHQNLNVSASGLTWELKFTPL